jgi:hypothetical protein
LMLSAVGWGCGGSENKGGETAESGTTETATPSTALEIQQVPPGSVPAAVDSTPPAPERLYKTVHDPNATYGESDLPQLGSYLKVDFTELNAAQLNRTIHRLRAEYCTCGCTNDTIDQCLVNDPACGTAVTLAKQIIREEKLKS